MEFWEILLICLSLSLDNFAVAATAGCSNKNLYFLRILRVCCAFVGAGIICLFAGFFGGKELGKIIGTYDHWVAFFILAYIGTKMILNIFKPDGLNKACPLTSLKTLMFMAIATNIDVLAIGISLALYKVNIWLVLITLCICIAAATSIGAYLGAILGCKLGRKAEFCGGIVLLLLSIKILING
ncbi:MAG: manganese efflux pump [Elusimicrobiaceae bacterium]|nr:manganese efflux pump [Elusimicrobiaceae bacterium]